MTYEEAHNHQWLAGDVLYKLTYNDDFFDVNVPAGFEKIVVTRVEHFITRHALHKYEDIVIKTDDVRKHYIRTFLTDTGENTTSLTDVFFTEDDAIEGIAEAKRSALSNMIKERDKLVEETEAFLSMRNNTFRQFDERIEALQKEINKEV